MTIAKSNATGTYRIFSFAFGSDTIGMSDTVRMCRIASCKREAATLCYHCQQDVYHAHFAQNSSMMMTDAYSLADQINILTDNITTFLTAQMRKNLFDQSQQW